jgi:hypothetical protein
MMHSVALGIPERPLRNGCAATSTLFVPSTVSRVGFDHRATSALDPRHVGEQRLGVGMVRRAKQLLGRRDLDDAAETQDHGAVRDFLHQAQVVAEDRESCLAWIALTASSHNRFGSRSPFLASSTIRVAATNAVGASRSIAISLTAFSNASVRRMTSSRSKESSSLNSDSIVIRDLTARLSRRRRRPATRPCALVRRTSAS